MSAADPVAAWCARRRADLLAREFDRSLVTVGPDKPIGSLLCDPRSARAWWRLIRLAVSTRYADGAQLLRASPVGARLLVQLADVDALAALLEAHRDTVHAAGWSLGLVDFLDRVRMERVAPCTPLYDVIARAYGDRTNPGIVDVVPGVAPAELLAAYAATYGQPDPAFVFFTSPNRDTPAAFPEV